ncbi:YhbY family RNA-binding protein [Candidimonas humi]|uniref:YhbY family RNA-binding protein n=1 Tax=Candidimonas humi TaxID=683355 RepID=A0ABV8NZM6_9BURK|nr:YhbY family RNA-binding protein [Candidimonas humi]MBV6306810.1 YhbY family RNA-binding protein [Candidimonas humi]
MAKLDITSRERSALRAAAHPLRPVVLIGDRGLSDSVLKEIDRNLTAHQLIKIRAGGEDRDARDAMLEAICDALSCAPVHHLGKTLIVYRPEPGAQAVPAKAAAPEPATRAQRKPTQPHTPKKQAAAGQTRTRSAEKAERAARKASRADTTAAPPKARRAAAQTPSHGIPRRPGSALSLRAGARRNLSRSGPKR